MNYPSPYFKNGHSSDSNSPEHGENKDEPFQNVLNVLPQPLPSPLENIQNNINGLSNNTFEGQVHMQEEYIDEINRDNKAQNDSNL